MKNSRAIILSTLILSMLVLLNISLSSPETAVEDLTLKAYAVNDTKAVSLCAKSHSYKTKTTDATPLKDGKKVSTCSVCGHKKTTAISRPYTYTFKTATYNGKNQKPTLTVKDRKGKVISSKNYTVTYPDVSKTVGKYTVTVKFKGDYSGTKKLQYTITPKNTEKLTVSQKTASLTAKWTEVKGATGYRVYLYKGSESVTSKTLNGETLTHTFKDLSAGTKYTVKIKAYKKVGEEKLWSSVKAYETATKPATPQITSVSALDNSITVRWKNVSGETGYAVYYSEREDGDFKKYATTKANTTKLTLKLSDNKAYYFKVIAYIKTANGNVNSARSKLATNFEQKNILQVNANKSDGYITGEWYNYSNGKGEYSYIQTGGCSVVSLVSAVYNLGGTIDKDEIDGAVKDVFNWAYSKGYWSNTNGLLNRKFFTESDDKFGARLGFKISGQYGKGNSEVSFDSLIKHLKSGGTAVVHCYHHFMVAADYKKENGKEYLLIFDNSPGKDTKYNSFKREGITSTQGDWFSLEELKYDGGKKGLQGDMENIELDAYWLVSKR